MDVEEQVRAKWKRLRPSMDERMRRLWVRAGARPEGLVRARRSPGKRPFEAAHPEVWPALEKLVDPVTRGDPESPLRWTCKSTRVLSSELAAQHGIQISDKTVGKLLREHKYSLQAPNRSEEHTSELQSR